MLAEVRKKVDQHLATYRIAESRVVEETQMLVEVEKRLEVAESAQKILQHVAQSVQEEAHKRISSVVTRCLGCVFDDVLGKGSYEFKIEFDQKRGRTEANLCFLRDGLLIDDPANACGGGVIDVAAFALRLACLMLARPAARRLLILDEPFRFVSEQYRQKIRELLLQVANEMGVQFIMVTHTKELCCGKVVEIQ